MRTATVTALLLIACGGDGAEAGFGSSAGGDPGFPAASGDCDVDGWTWLGEVAVDPDTCLAWSPRFEGLTWHEAVSPAEAADGGCSEDCDEAPGDDWCANLGEIDGVGGWSLPDLDTLEALSVHSPPFEELSGELWSRTTDPNVEGLAWAVELSEPGRSVALDKSGALAARCVARAP